MSHKLYLLYFEMECLLGLSNHCWHIRLRPYVFVLSLLSVFFACVANQNGVTVEESIPKGTEKPATSADLTQDPLTKILNLKQDKPSFNIDIWTDKKMYRVGEEIRFYFVYNGFGFCSPCGCFFAGYVWVHRDGRCSRC